PGGTLWQRQGGDVMRPGGNHARCRVFRRADARHAAAGTEAGIRTGSLGNAELFRELEMPLVPVLAEMELAGVSIDLPYLQQVSRELYEQLQSLDQEIADVAHGPINVNSPQQLARFLFEDLDLPGGRKTKSGYSTDASVLEGLRDQHPVVAKILEFRQL